MVKRSIQASEAGIEKAKKAFQRKGWTQEYLAAEVGLGTRQSIWKFFTGRPIERTIFLDICFKLDLDWQEVADLPSETTDESENLSPLAIKIEAIIPNEIDKLVQQVRELLFQPMVVQCGILRLLDTSESVALDDVYINVNIIEQLAHQRWLEVSDLQSPTTERVGLIQMTQKKVAALQAIATYSKLIVLGKPGSGKTTFIQSLALQCIRGKLQPHRLPIFIRIRNWAREAHVNGNFNLFNYISGKLSDFGICTPQIDPLLKQGRALILLDGLDEIHEKDADTILKEINQFVEFYYQNQYIITCRLAAQTYRFPGFTNVEIADFDNEQIEAFAKKWFVTASRQNCEEGLNKATQFIEKLNRQDNQPIRELAATPILLTLLASVFQTKAEFPNKRCKLYEAALDILLVRWDEARGIHRDEFYCLLPLPEKIKLLSQIAARTFEQGNNFFEQSEINQYIADYLATLPSVNLDPETLRLNSDAVIKSIEVQHGLLVERARGIYSFSHLTFQEYLTARHIVANSDSTALLEALQGLVAHLTEPRWREVFLLTAGLLRNADPLLQGMKQQIDAIMAADQKLQQFLFSINQKSCSLKDSDKPAAVRAFYFSLFLDQDMGLAAAIEPYLYSKLPPELALDMALSRTFSLVLNCILHPDNEQILALGLALDLDYALKEQPQLHLCLQQLKNQLPDPVKGKDYLIQWWQIKGQIWAEKFRIMLIEHRQIGYPWKFNSQQLAILQAYYQANKLLVDCLNSGCLYSAIVKADIDTSLLLPVTEMETIANKLTLPWQEKANSEHFSPIIIN